MVRFVGGLVGSLEFQVRSKEEALEWVKRWPALDAGGEVELELRQVFEAEDFGEEFGEELTPELREQEELLRARSENPA